MLYSFYSWKVEIYVDMSNMINRQLYHRGKKVLLQTNDDMHVSFPEKSFSLLLCFKL